MDLVDEPKTMQHSNGAIYKEIPLGSYVYYNMSLNKIIKYIHETRYSLPHKTFKNRFSHVTHYN